MSTNILKITYNFIDCFRYNIVQICTSSNKSNNIGINLACFIKDTFFNAFKETL